MKKSTESKKKKIKVRRERKILKRRRRNKKYREKFNSNDYKNNPFRWKVDKQLIKKYKNQLFDFFNDQGFVSTPTRIIKIKKSFSIEGDSENALNQLAEIHTAIHFFLGEIIELDFSNCAIIDLHTVTLLRIIVNEYSLSQYKLQQKISTISVKTQIRVHHSQYEMVNKRLFAGGILPSINVKEDQMMPISTIGIHKGDRTQTHYGENKKGTTATKISRYVNQICNDKYSFILSRAEQNEMEELVSEVLNNAEDHGQNNEWFANATLFEERRTMVGSNEDSVGELFITIVNFGRSFYEGLLDTQTQNAQTFNILEELYTKVIQKPGGGAFSRENYFTLFALQDGVSRLKFEQESRGTGTMKFINSFLYIGDYQSPDKNYWPRLSLLSGKTYLICDNEYRSFKSPVNNDYYLTLNAEKDLNYPPARSHLKSLPTYFPGTVLAVTLYLDRTHLSTKKMSNHARKN